MTSGETPRIGPHDFAGLDAGPVDTSQHDLAQWERVVDAIIYLLGRKGVMKDVAELRRHIEDLGPDVYERLSYYERWAASAAATCVEAGVVTREELDARAAEIAKRSEAS